MNEGRAPRTDAGFGLADLVDNLYDEGRIDSSTHTKILDGVGQTLEDARSQERAAMAFQLGLVAGEGYKGWKELEDWIEALLATWSSNTKGGLFDELWDILNASRKATASKEPDGS